MPLIALQAKFDKPILLKQLKRELPGITKTSLEVVGRHWATEILPAHFASGNASKYQHEKRNAFYKTVVKRIEGEGAGKTVDLQLKGRSRREILFGARITATSNKATVTMPAPIYFTNPKIGKVEKTIKTKTGGERTITINIRHQPDKPAELTRVNDVDRRKLQRVFESDLAFRIRYAMKVA